MQLDLPELRQEWTKLYGSPAPQRVSRDLLQRALAHRLQELAEGGLNKKIKRELLVSDAAIVGGQKTKATVTFELKPGTRLIRDWQGERHQVDVLQVGYGHRGAHYKSLSQVARAITGTRWSGPLFFGLRKAKAKLPPKCHET
jgi:hypothetical protein